MKTYDVAIIGGGLAGLASAIQMADYGKSVLVLEKKHYPFHRVCGEYVSMESWGFLHGLGLDLKSEDLPFINKLHVSSPSGKLLKHELNPGGFGISRYKLDAMLAHLATQKGVDLHTGASVSAVKYMNNQWDISAGGKDFQATLALGCFGKRSNVDYQQKREHLAKSKKSTTNYVAVKYHVLADLPDDLIELHNFDNGYCGISKVEGNRYCMCYLTTSNNLEKSNNDITEMESTVLSQNPYLKDYFNRFEKLYDNPLSIAQLDFSNKRVIENNMLMVGDSAGLITPLCGNGMSMALRGSSIVAPLLLDYLNGSIERSQLNKNYEKRWNEEFKTRLKAGRLFQSLFGSKIMTEVVVAILGKSPSLMKKLVALTHGKPF